MLTGIDRDTSFQGRAGDFGTKPSPEFFTDCADCDDCEQCGSPTAPDDLREIDAEGHPMDGDILCVDCHEFFEALP